MKFLATASRFLLGVATDLHITSLKGVVAYNKGRVKRAMAASDDARRVADRAAIYRRDTVNYEKAVTKEVNNIIQAANQEAQGLRRNAVVG